MTLADSAVYTILHPDRLGEIAASARPTRLRETKRWVTAKKLFDEARRQDRDMGVLYADAAYDCSKLIYWGKVTQMDLDAHGTSYTVTELANCVFRTNLGTDSGDTWAPVPDAPGHRFRRTWAPIPVTWAPFRRSWPPS